MPKQYKPLQPVHFMGLQNPVRDGYGAYRHHGPHAGIDIYDHDRLIFLAASLCQRSVSNLSPPKRWINSTQARGHMSWIDGDKGGIGHHIDERIPENDPRMPSPILIHRYKNCIT